MDSIEMATAAEVARDLAKENATLAQSVRTLTKNGVEGRPFLVVPDGRSSFTVIGLDNYAPGPEIRNRPQLRTVASFRDYWNKFREDGSVITADGDDKKFVVKAHFDYHDRPQDEGTGLEETMANWCVHTATLPLDFSPELIAWRDMAARCERGGVDQKDLANFLDDHIDDVRGGDGLPSGSDLLALCEDFHATRSVKFASGQRASNGTVVLNYQEEVEATAGRKGQVVIPTHFRIGVPVFDALREEVYGIKVAFRYDINEGKLKLFIKLIQLADVIRQAQDEVIGQVEKLCGVKVFRGTLL